MCFVSFMSVRNKVPGCCPHLGLEKRTVTNPHSWPCLQCRVCMWVSVCATVAIKFCSAPEGKVLPRDYLAQGSHLVKECLCVCDYNGVELISQCCLSWVYSISDSVIHIYRLFSGFAFPYRLLAEYLLGAESLGPQ